jgi:hypothetical protein
MKLKVYETFRLVVTILFYVKLVDPGAKASILRGDKIGHCENVTFV